MEREQWKKLLELAGGPAFAVAEDGVLRVCTPEAEALGFRKDVPAEELLPEGCLPKAAGESLETELELSGQRWSLRAMETEGLRLCFLRPAVEPVPGPNEATLVHAASSIRRSLQELTTALNGLADVLPPEDPGASRRAAEILRSIYRLRRAAGSLEAFSSLRSGRWRLIRRRVKIAAETAAFCGELRELLQAAGIELVWSLPQRDFPVCVDWDLLQLMLRELTANAAAHSADGRVELRLTRVGELGLRFAVSNRTDQPLPRPLFHRHAAEPAELEGGAGLGLSMVSAGAACHGGSLLLSADETGVITALLTVRGGAEEDAADSFAQLRQIPAAEAELVSFSELLPPELYRVEDLL